jgi:hypothetical protein
VLLRLLFSKFKRGWVSPCSSGLIPQILFDVKPRRVLPYRFNVSTSENKGMYQNQFLF